MGILRRSKEERELRAIVKEQELPHFSEITLRILERLRDPAADFAEVADSLQWEPGLVVRLLRTVNSAAYGVSARIEDVRHAISFMGRSQLEQLVLANAIKESLPRTSAMGFQHERFWRAAAFRAALARAFAHELHPARNAEAFTAGLLQDMAVPVLAHARPDDYGPVLEAWHAGDGESLDDLERDVFGWCHAKVGGMLGQVWQLPEPLVGAISMHHSDEHTDQEVLPATRLVARLREHEDERDQEALIEHARADYGLAPDWTCETLEACRGMARDLASVMLA